MNTCVANQNLPPEPKDHQIRSLTRHIRPISGEYYGDPNLTETEAKIEGDLSYGLDLITRMLPTPVSMDHLEENLIAGIHYLTQAAEAMGYDMSAPFPQSGPQRPEWDLQEVWQALYRYHTEPVAESQLGEILNAVRRTREADKYTEPSVFDSSDR